LLVGSVSQTQAQSYELQQLILDVEKLMQFKQILADMKTGYEILSQGYEAVKDISAGNFTLHRVFLDGLLKVSPTVQQYDKIALIVSMQVDMVKEYKAAWKQCTGSQLLNEGELDYINQVFKNLLDRSAENIEDLTTVLTAGKLRMSDDERLAAIDRIYEEVQNQLQFLRVFHNQNSVLLLLRTKDMNDARGIKKMYVK
jgi:hypothetical protein